MKNQLRQDFPSALVVLVIVGIAIDKNEGMLYVGEKLFAVLNSSLLLNSKKGGAYL